jgi:hypothetical protein
VHASLGLAIMSSPTAILYLGPDASIYHQGAIDIVRNWSGQTSAVLLPGGKEGFFYLLAVIYRLFGSYPLAGVIVNSVFAAALVPVMSDLTRRLFDDSAAKYAPPLVVLLPGYLIWPSQLLREACVLLLLAVSANCVARLSEKGRIGALACLGGTIALLYSFRGQLALLFTGAIVVALVVGCRGQFSAFGAPLGIVAMVAALVLGGGLGYSGYRLALEADLQEANAFRLETSTTANSGFDPSTDISTPEKASAYLPLAFVKFMFGPFPWEVDDTRQVPALLDVSVLWMLVPSMWRGLKGALIGGWRSLVLLLPALAIALPSALAVGNYGMVLRERTQVLTFLVPFIAVGLALRGVPATRTPFGPVGSMSGARK